MNQTTAIGLPVFTYAKGNSSHYLKYLSAILVITGLLGLRCLVSWFKNVLVTSWEMLRQCVLQPNLTWFAWFHTSTLLLLLQVGVWRRRTCTGTEGMAAEAERIAPYYLCLCKSTIWVSSERRHGRYDCGQALCICHWEWLQPLSMC